MTEVEQVLQQQLTTTWALLDHHVQQWHDDNLFWEPAQSHWTMHQVEGGWAPDFAHDPRGGGRRWRPPTASDRRW